MKEKITNAKQIRKVREAFRVQYSKFQKDFNELGERFRQITIDADCLLSAAEQIVEVKD